MLETASAAVVTRRVAVGALAATGLGYTLFGPRGDRRDEAGRTVIDYWEKWTGAEGAAMLEIVDRFNAAQSRYRVRYFTTGDIAQKAKVAIAGGDPPDVLGLWSYSLPAFAESGALLPLDDFGTAHGLGIEHYAPSVWPLMHHEGRRWAAINTCGTTALYYDRAAFREAGLDPDRPPTTIREFDACADRLTRRDGDGTITRAGFLHVEPGWWSWSWGHYFGGTLVDDTGLRATAAGAANRRAYEWAQGYPERYGLDDLSRLRSTFGNYASMQQSFLAGKVAMVMQGPWLANIIAAHRPDLDYGAAPFPVDDSILDAGRPLGALEADLLVVPRGARHPEAARAFIAFTQHRAQVERLSLAHAKGSPLREVSADFRARHPNRALAVHDAILRSPRAFSTPAVRVWPQYRDEFNSAMDRIWSLRAPAAEVLALVERRAQAHLDLASLRRRQRTARGRTTSS